MFGSIVLMGLGVLILLQGSGRVQMSKNPAANAAHLQRWGLLLRICGGVMVLSGAVGLVARVFKGF